MNKVTIHVERINGVNVDLKIDGYDITFNLVEGDTVEVKPMGRWKITHDLERQGWKGLSEL